VIAKPARSGPCPGRGAGHGPGSQPWPGAGAPPAARPAVVGSGGKAAQGRGVPRVARRWPGAVFGAVVLIAAALGTAAASVAAGPGYPVVIDIQNASARVGERAVIVATIRIGDGFKITDSYGHRLGGLAAASDGVALEQRLVRGSIRNDTIVFTVPVTPTRPGTHTVSGIFRFSYHDGHELDIRAARFEATVTGTD